MSDKIGNEIDAVSKWDNPVDIVCNGGLTTFPTRKIARDFFLEGICGTEGSERDRYMAIFIGLEEPDRKMVHDGEPQEEDPRIHSICQFKDDHIGDRRWLDKPTTYNSYIDSQNSVVPKIHETKVPAKSNPSSALERNAEKSRLGGER